VPLIPTGFVTAPRVIGVDIVGSLHPDLSRIQSISKQTRLNTGQTPNISNPIRSRLHGNLAKSQREPTNGTNQTNPSVHRNRRDHIKKSLE
jgi:hypothetical protein